MNSAHLQHIKRGDVYASQEKYDLAVIEYCQDLDLREFYKDTENFDSRELTESEFYPDGDPAIDDDDASDLQNDLNKELNSNVPA